MKSVILAGGSGERFWPLSTKDTPKQFLKLFSDKTLIRQTFERLSYKLPPKDIYVVTNRMYAQKTYEELPEVPKENILLEPLKKNTAPACTWATLQFDEEETVFIVPADHYIPDVEKFWSAVELAEKFLQDSEGIITFGIVPTGPETGYGYIEVDQEISDNVYAVKMFREKPNYETAVEYISSGRFFWNSGMFMWKKKHFLEQMRKHSNGVLEPFYECRSIEETYEKVPSISIDYALMEKADKIYTIKANFVWSDVGNWKSLEELGVENSPNSVLIDSKAFVQTTKTTIVIGLEDVIVVETENGVLVAKSTELEKIRAALGKLDGVR